MPDLPGPGTGCVAMLGERGVDVLLLNLALDRACGTAD
jgi:hypothetical protein